MNILLYDFLNSYIQYDLLYYLKKMGHKCNNILYRKQLDKYEDTAFMDLMEKEVSGGRYDMVLTTNFWPVVSKVCNKHDLPYVSWFFDSPPNLPTAECMEYPCNRIYFFTKGDYANYKGLGLDNVFYLPLAVNIDRLDSVRADQKKYGAEISFVGRLYESMLPAIKANMTDYQKGYVDSVVNAQTMVYGGYLLDDLITESFAESVRERYRSLSETAIQITRQELAWAVASHVTHLERMSLLRLLSARHEMKLYTYELTEGQKKLLPDVKFCGPVDYLKEMPQVFKASKVNLCPVLKANRTGIPLRALDIMGCGGFLLSSYQQELDEYFLDGEECVMYSSIEDALAKADFYLKNTELRERISASGMEKIREQFRYEDRIEKLIS